MKKYAGAFIALFLTFSLFATPELEVDFDTAKIREVGEKISLRVKADGGASCVITEHNESLEKSDSTTVVPLGEEFVLSSTVDRPGFVLFDVDLRDEKGAKILSKSVGFAFEPEKIVRDSASPVDFDEFWNSQLDRLAKVPIRELERIEVDISDSGYADSMRCYDVKIECVDGVPVSGYLVIPKNAAHGSLPAVVTYHGAGVFSAFKKFNIAAAGAMVLDINAHGSLNGQPPEYYTNLTNNDFSGYFMRGINNRNDCYFTNMFLRVKRSLDYMKSLPEWDGENLITAGGSQGGAQALVGAALDESVTFTAPQAPWLCNFNGKLSGRNFPTWPAYIAVDQNNKPENPEIVETLQYFDMVNFAGRIDCEVSLSLGLLDTCCLPSGIFTMYNEIPSENKSFQIFEDETHAGPWLYHAGTEAVIKKLESLK